MATLLAKRQRFVDEYLVDLNATQAAIRAGYSVRSAQQQGARLLLNDVIKAAIDAGRAQMAARTDITQDYVLTTIRETIERCRQTEPVRYQNGDQVYVTTPTGDIVPAYKFDASGVLRGAELLAKHLGMLTDKQSIKLEGGLSHDWTVRVVEPGAAVASLPEDHPVDQPKARRRPELGNA